MNSSPAEKQCVNDLLYFLDFKRKTNSVSDVVSICEAFYAPDAILSAKKAFFDVVGEHEGIKFTSRRGLNPAKSNLDDLVNAMNKCDNDSISMPTFLSSDFAKILHTDDRSVSLNQILFILVGIKTQLASLEKKSVNLCCSASTSWSSAVDSASTDASLSASDAFSSTPPSASSVAPPEAPSALSNAPSDTSSILSQPAPSPLPTGVVSIVASSISGTSGVLAQESFASVMNQTPKPPLITQGALQNALKSALPKRPKNDKQIKGSAENRIKTNHDRNKNIVIGKKTSSGTMSWGGAPLTVDCYVGRVDFSVSAEQIKADIVAMGIDVVGIEANQTRHSLFKSFKLVIKKMDFPNLNTPEVWPEGVVFRRFRRPRPPTTGHDDSPNNS